MSRKWKNRAPQIKASQDEAREFRASAGVKVAIEAAEPGNEKKRLPTFSMVAYTGAPMTPEGWLHPVICDLDGIECASQHRPILRQHDHEKLVGHSKEIKVSQAQGILVHGVISNPNSPYAKEIVETSGNEFEWQASIGANPVKKRFLRSGETAHVNGRDITGPMWISQKTIIGEISFVPLGADGDTSASVTASQRKGNPVDPKSALKFAMSLMASKAKFGPTQIEAMTDEEATIALTKCMNAADEDDEEEKKKKEDEEKKAEAAQIAGIRAALRKEASAETLRIAGIQAAVKKHGVSEIELDGKKVNLAAHAIDNNWSEDKVELHALRASRPAAHVGNSPHFYSPSQGQLSDAVLECALFDAMGNFRLFDSDFYRVGDTVSASGQSSRRTSEREENRITSQLKARYTDQVRQTAHTMFRGRIGLQQVLTMIAGSAGYRGSEVIRDPESWGTVSHFLAKTSLPIQADSSTINVANVLANVQNKFILQGYLFTEQSFMDIVQVLSVKDFKPTKSVALFGDFQFRDLNPAGEIQHGTLGDQGFANQAGLVARMLTIPLTYIVNDDLGILGQVPMMLGRGWGLKLNELVWAEFMDTANVDDGGNTAFWASTHTISGQSGNSNLSSGAGSALGSAGLQAAKLLFDRQVDPAGKPLGIDPEIIVYPPELDVTAMELMNAQFILMAGLASTSSASKQPNTNIWARRFKPVMSRYLSNSSFTGYSATAWYMLANPAIMPVVQLAAWNGNLVPTVQTAGQDWQFNTLGISMRGYGGVGANIQNFRGGVKSAGS